MVKIILDAMGGDNAPQVTVEGAVGALAKDKELYLVLTGRKDEIEAELKKYDYDKSRLEIVDCPDVIGMNDDPAMGIKYRDKSSIVVAYKKLRSDDDMCGLVTAGSTGAAVAGARLLLNKLDGVKRPALCAVIPNSRGGFTLLVDCGANAECKPLMLCQFAVLGAAYSRARFGVKNPKIGLLNNGTEEHKGDPLHRETRALMAQINGINFVGNVEGRDITIGDCDVVVCDGFSGNIALKSIEGAAKLVLATMKEELSSSLSSKIGYLFIRKSIKRMRAKLDFNKVGGALLLGVSKAVVKSHGSSKPETIIAAIENAAAIYRSNMIGSISDLLAEAHLEKLTVNNE